MLLASKQAARRPVCVIAVVENVDPGLAQLSTKYDAMGPGVLGGIFDRFESWGVRDVALLGAVSKATVLNPETFDEVGLRLIRGLRDASDRALLGAVVEAFVERGFEVADQRQHLPDMIVPEGTLVEGAMDPVLANDIHVSLRIAQAVAEAGIGQTAVVKQGVTVAIEAIEGTDATIRRGAALAGDGVVVAKAAHPHHDFRCDAPTVGLDTLEVMGTTKARALVLEAGRGFLLHRMEFAQRARDLGIHVVGV